jgi:geranylgeranyl reductase family protein
MNLSLDQLPDACDVLVVGAGPAGSAAAIVLAKAGLDVVLADQHTFPRDKVCGDALIPDAHAALKQLGLLRAVMAKAQAVEHVGCVAPRGGRVDVPGRLAVLPRRELDDLLCRGAVLAGARMVAPARLVEVLEDGAGKVTGARLRGAGSVRDLHARWVVLATGAVPQALIAAGMCERQLPSGVALRGYVKNPGMADRLRGLDIVWDRALRPGYGWIFPCGEGVFNIGVGVSHGPDQRKRGGMSKDDGNLHDIFKAFTECYAPARDLMEGGQLLGDLKGAPLRFGLEGARRSRPGLLVTGEAAGSTYAFTGEGIGKAMQTGILAAEAVTGPGDLGDAAVRERYEQALLALKPRFDLYTRANKVNAHPWLMDLLVWRARKNPRLVRRMSGVLDETCNPGHLVSVRGVLKLFTS